MENKEECYLKKIIGLIKDVDDNLQKDLVSGKVKKEDLEQGVVNLEKFQKRKTSQFEKDNIIPKD